ncbi:MAG: hypothetical protein J7L96_09700 [Bacteroidales bacterium]|nr:hypothetical protein [Bacteroidales bacterium]
MNRLYVIFILVLLLFSCKKEVPESFIFGLPGSDMSVELLQPAFQLTIGANDSYDYDLDIDQDGTADLRFSGYSGIASSGQTTNGWDVSTLNKSFEFAAEEVQHSFSQCRLETEDRTYITYFSDKSSYQCDNELSACDRVEKKWSPFMYSPGDKVEKRPDWRNESTLLTSFHYHNDYIGHVENNEVFSAYYEVYGNWPGAENKYLLIRDTKGHKDKYGWIRLSFISTYSIEISEYALQIN